MVECLGYVHFIYYSFIYLCTKEIFSFYLFTLINCLVSRKPPNHEGLESSTQWKRDENFDFLNLKNQKKKK